MSKRLNQGPQPDTAPPPHTAVEARFTFHPGGTTVTVEGGHVVVTVECRHRLVELEIGGRAYAVIIDAVDDAPKIAPLR